MDARIFKEAWQAIRRHRWLTVSSLLVMTATFWLTSIFAVVAWGSGLILEHLESRAQITVFFKDEVSPEEILNLKASLEGGGRVAVAEYVSKEEALQIYMGQHQDEPILLESITANIFPASLEIRARELSDLPGLAVQLEQESGVEEVVFYKDVVETFRRWSNLARWGGLGLVGFLGLISVLIVLLTIGMTIHTRREEIEIMALVGATDWYISGPFLVQGAFYGLVAALFSSLLLLALLPAAAPLVREIFGGLPLPALNWWFFAALFLGQLLFGTLLGVLGSFAATKKYLRD